MHMGYYNAISKGYNELHGEEQRNKARIIKDNIKINKNTKLLDVGCGTGISSDFDCFVIGIDSSPGLLAQNNNAFRVLGSAENLPFRNDSFDYVISVTAMHNFKDIVKSINEMKRVGKENFVFSILKKSQKFDGVIKIIKENFKIEKSIVEEKDMILFCKK